MVATVDFEVLPSPASSHSDSTSRIDKPRTNPPITGRKKVIIAGASSNTCPQLSALDILADGCEVYAAIDGVWVGEPDCARGGDRDPQHPRYPDPYLVLARR
jgi:hypothetical protein